MKNISVIVSGVPGGNIRDVTLQPGITAGDVLRALGLQGYLLSIEGSGQAFAAEEPIYDRFVEGGKARATPLSEVGNLSSIDGYQSLKDRNQ
jgi:hypothetical protein